MSDPDKPDPATTGGPKRRPDEDEVKSGPWSGAEADRPAGDGTVADPPSDATSTSEALPDGDDPDAASADVQPAGDTPDMPAEEAAETDTGDRDGDEPDASEPDRTDAPRDEAPQDEAAQGGGLSLAARALIALVLLLAGATGGIAAFPWLADRLGPWIPALQAGAASGGGIDPERLEALETADAAQEKRLAVVDRELGRLAKEVEALRQAEAELRRAAETGASVAVRTDASDLEPRLDALERQIAALSERPAAGGDAEGRQAAEVAPASGAAIVAAQVELTRLSGALDGLRSRSAQRSAALEARLAAAEAAIERAGARDKAAAAVLALAQLRERVRAGVPFARELDTASRLLADPSGLQPLAPHAADGLGALDTLVHDFAPVARAVVRAGQQPAGEGWMERTTARLSDLVTVRRVGDVAGADVDAIVARAELRLGRGDLAGAVRELRALEGKPAEAAAGWLARADERLGLIAGVDAALDAAIAAAGQG